MCVWDEGVTLYSRASFGVMCVNVHDSRPAEQTATTVLCWQKRPLVFLNVAAKPATPYEVRGHCVPCIKHHYELITKNETMRWFCSSA
jgi:hypothetical protein